MMAIIGFIVWYLIGVAGFVFWWTKDGDLETSTLPLMAFAGLSGPFAWVIGMTIHADTPVTPTGLEYRSFPTWVKIGGLTLYLENEAQALRVIGVLKEIIEPAAVKLGKEVE